MRELPPDYYDLMPTPPTARLESQLHSKIYVSCAEFCSQLDEFFALYSHGSLGTDISEPTARIFISPYGFSFIVKRIVALLDSPDDLKLFVSKEGGSLCLEFEINTRTIENFLYQSLCRLASLSGMGFLMKPNMIILTAEIISSETLSIYAGKAHLLYAALKDNLMPKSFTEQV